MYKVEFMGKQIKCVRKYKYETRSMYCTDNKYDDFYISFVHDYYDFMRSISVEHRDIKFEILDYGNYFYFEVYLPPCEFWIRDIKERNKISHDFLNSLGIHASLDSNNHLVIDNGFGKQEYEELKKNNSFRITKEQAKNILDKCHYSYQGKKYTLKDKAAN